MKRERHPTSSYNQHSDKLLTVMKLLTPLESVLLFMLLSLGTSTLARTSSAAPGLFIEYTLTTANSPDCEPSLVDNYPVQVQYRTIFISAESTNNSNDIEATEWMDSPNKPTPKPG